MDLSQTIKFIKSVSVGYTLQWWKKKIFLFGFTTIFFIITYYYLLTNATLSKPYIVLQKIQDNNISCHHWRDGDVLPAAEKILVSSPENSIFFHETSCRGGLDPRQACSIESAARAHPSWQINVLFSSPVTELILERTYLAKLSEFNNIKFARVHINEYAKGTPLESLVNNGSLERSYWRVEHTSDVLRYLTLYKWGGVYLDTDMIVVKPFDDLAGNWVGKQDDAFVNAAAIGLSRDAIGRKFANIIINELRTSFKPDVWIQNGPGVITRVLQQTCSTKNISEWSQDTCGFPVYDPEYFYPVPYESKDLYFSKEELENVNRAYTHHIWNKLSKDTQITADSVYAKLAKIYCPSIYNFFGSDFGR